MIMTNMDAGAAEFSPELYRARQKLTNMDAGAAEFSLELYRARQKFGPMNSAHEGYAIILEELDELWNHVKQKQTARDHVEMRKEVVQLGAMVLAFLLEVVDADNRR